VNLIEAKVIGRDEKGVLLRGETVPTPVRVPTDDQLAVGAAVTVALRPEKVKITVRRPVESVDNTVRGVVTGIAYLGDFSLYRVRLENGFVFQAARPNVTRVTDQPVTWEDRVYLSWTPEAAVVLTR
jgi:putrescine transport system ATP-binding protein